MITKQLILSVAACCCVFVTSCSKSSPSTSESSLLSAVKLPPVAIGNYTGTFMLREGGETKIAAGGATCRVAEAGERYDISFIGGTPTLGPGTPSIRNVLFAKTPGSQVGVYHSLARDGSVAGIHVSTYMTNINVEVDQGSSKIIFTGRK